MNKFAVLLVLLCHFGTPEAGSQTAPATAPRTYTMNDCLKLSVENSPRLKIQAIEKMKLGYSRSETMGGALPHVNFGGSWDDYLHLPTQLIPGEFFGRPGEMIPVQFGTTYNLAAGLDASQMIYNQSWLTGMKLAKQMLMQQDLNIERDQTELVYEVAQSYYLVQITRQQIRNMEANLAKIEKAEKITTSQYENGLIKKVDLDRIVVQKLNLVTETERLQVNLKQQFAMLKYYMGLDQSVEIAVTDSVSTGVMAPEPSADYRDHIDIRMMEMQKRVISTGIRMDQSGYYPTVNLIASVNYLNQSNTMYLFGKPADWFNTSLVGIRVSVPVFSGLQRHNKVNQTRMELEKIRVMEDDALRMIRINSEDASRKLVNSVDAERRQRENMRLAERVYAISQEQYHKGVIPLTDLLNAETALSDAQVNHTYALIQMKQSELSYLKANGKLLDVLMP